MKYRIIKYFFRSLICVSLAFALVSIARIFYAEVPLDENPNYIVLIMLSVVLFEVLLSVTKKWGRIGAYAGIFLIIFFVASLAIFEGRWRHQKYLYLNYVVDFSYDKYCNMSWEDRYILEEISIYGVTDCDDAKIPYKKIQSAD